MSHPSWFPESRVPSGEECALGLVLRKRAERDPDGSFAVFGDGAEWSNCDALALAEAAARGLVHRGVAAGDRVVILLPNSAAFVRLFLGAILLGALPVPVHVALQGRLLRNALELANPRLVITHSTLADAVRPCLPTASFTVVEIDLEPDLGAGGTQGGESPSLVEPPAAWSLACLLFTSGTTGGTKAVRIRNGQLWSVAKAHFGFLRPDDRLMITTPLCHIGPLSGFVGAMIHGGSMVILESFKTSSFWQDLRRFEATAIPGLGPSLLHFLNSAPPAPDDADNPLRIVNTTTMGPEARHFGQRFKVDMFSSFGMTEISVAMISDVNCDRDGTCGRPRNGVEIRIVDEHDMEVPPGSVGEITLRAQHPWVLSDGYEGNPQATVDAWRNGWFHTGDLARRDHDGYVYFADRLKDVIRRRGENISSAEVEREARAHPGVREAAAVGVASDQGDEDVMLVVSALAGSGIDPRELHDFLVGRLPHFMTPRFIRIIDELPKTASAKVIKARLREEGLTPDVWDRTVQHLAVRQRRIGEIR